MEKAKWQSVIHGSLAVVLALAVAGCAAGEGPSVSLWKSTTSPLVVLGQTPASSQPEIPRIPSSSPRPPSPDAGPYDPAPKGS